MNQLTDLASRTPVDSFVKLFSAIETSFLVPSLDPLLNKTGFAIVEEAFPAAVALLPPNFTASLNSIISSASDFLSPLQLSASWAALPEPHPHARLLPLMNISHVLAITVAYLLTIFVGVNVMRALPKLSVFHLALMHNLCMVTLSAYMCVTIVAEAWNRGYVLFGNAVDSSESGIPMAKFLWLFYVSKIFEFMDTFIMVLKKNNHQISFLHVYHHSSIFIVWWAVITIAPGGEAYFSAALNSFIHVVMYGYYFLAALGVRQVAFVKKYITLMQMTQFCLMLVQSICDQYLVSSGRLDYSKFITQLLFVYMISMLALFANFFMKDRKKDGERLKRLMGKPSRPITVGGAPKAHPLALPPAGKQGNGPFTAPRAGKSKSKRA